MRLKKGDTVVVISGANKGKEGKILKVYPLLNRVIVEGVNIIKKHTKPSQLNPDGGIREYEAPFHASNVMLLTKEGPSKIGYRFEEVKGKDKPVKVRYAKKTGETLD